MAQANAVIYFNAATKHGKFNFLPGVSYGFENADLAAYFKAAGWAVDSSDDPVLVITNDEVEFDPNTVFGTNGEKQGSLVVTGE